MKRLSPLSVVLLLTIPVVILMQTPSAQSEPVKSDALLRHMVLLKFKEGTSDEKVQEVVDTFAALPQEISEIHEFEMGEEVTGAPFAKGFTHCFLLTFQSEEDRDTYVAHPSHQNLVVLITPIAGDVLVVDYWAGA